MQLFYIPGFSGMEGELPPNESYHCYKVLRLKNGEIINLTNGLGSLFDARIDFIDPKHTRFTIIKEQPNYGKRNFHVHIAIAPTKNMDRFEWFVEKSCELGIDRISPLICERSERRMIKTERIQNIAVSAIKQSLKAYIPVIDPIISYKDFIKLYKNQLNTARFIAHCNWKIDINLFASCSSGSSALVLIGPEGDFSKSEVEYALQYGFKEVTLGDSRLRTETAGIAACHIINLINL